MKKIFTLLLAAIVAVSVGAITRLPDPGVYKIKNVYSGTYVVLQHNYLADITAETADEASDLLVWYGERDANGEALLTNLSGDGGDMIETLEFIRGLIEEVLEYNDKPTWFLEEMFQLHLVPTGDDDGSVYLCVDVPAIDNWEEIRDIILDAAAGQTAVKYYITHMVPGNRHYMGIDYDGSFGYRLQAGTPEGTDIKFIMDQVDFEQEILEGGFCYVKTASTTSDTPYLRRVHSKRSTIDLADPHNDASAVFELDVENNQVNKLAVQGLDLASLATAIGEGAYLSLCQTNTTADKFTYGYYVLKLQLPDENVDATAVLAAAAQALGADSELYAALSNHSDWIVDRAALYFVHGNNGDVTIACDANLAEYADRAKWQLEFIDTDDNYFAPEATIEADGKYYTTLYAAFPYTIVNPSNVAAYLLVSVDSEGTPELQLVTDEVIPAGTAVLLECTSQTDTDNMLLPGAATSGSGTGAPRYQNALGALQGTYFDDEVVNDKTTMLTLQSGLTFAVDNESAYMPANKAWAEKEAVTAVTTIRSDVKPSDENIYDLMGRRVVNPTHGIYIQNGKKIVR